jgi:chemotaxis protein methyltransferase CheR
MANATQSADKVDISAKEYARIRAFLYKRVGIELGGNKQPLVMGRLCRRLDALGMSTYSEYFDAIEQETAPGELQQAIDLLTTNETYFYREPRHFDNLMDIARQHVRDRRPLRIWSAACSSAEEAYTIAMMLQSLVDTGVPLKWEIFGSDISERILETALRATYPLSRTTQLPPALLKKYCLKGSGPADGQVLVSKAIRSQVRFGKINLVETLPDIGPFDVIFLRNVLIYFDTATKRQVVNAITSKLAEGGTLFVGLAESLNGVVSNLVGIAPGMYQVKSGDRS